MPKTQEIKITRRHFKMAVLFLTLNTLHELPKNRRYNKKVRALIPKLWRLAMHMK